MSLNCVPTHVVPHRVLFSACPNAGATAPAEDGEEGHLGLQEFFTLRCFAVQEFFTLRCFAVQDFFTLTCFAVQDFCRSGVL